MARNYTNLASTDEFAELIKSLYFPSNSAPEELVIPKMHFLMVSGKGQPGSESFQKAIQSLYGIAFSIKMGLKFKKITAPAGYYDFKVPPLEGRWLVEAGGQFGLANQAEWQWQLMILMPSFVTDAIFETAKDQAKAKHPGIPYDSVKLWEFEEGQSIQLMHIGPYTAEEPTINRLLDYAKQKGYQINGQHHEIYMGDPRRTKPEKLKTILRYPVR